MKEVGPWEVKRGGRMGEIKERIRQLGEVLARDLTRVTVLGRRVRREVRVGREVRMWILTSSGAESDWRRVSMMGWSLSRTISSVRFPRTTVDMTAFANADWTAGTGSLEREGRRGEMWVRKRAEPRWAVTEAMEEAAAARTWDGWELGWEGGGGEKG